MRETKEGWVGSEQNVGYWGTKNKPLFRISTLICVIIICRQSSSFDLTYAQPQRLNINPTPCNQHLNIPPFNPIRANLGWQQTVGNFPTYPSGWPYPSSQVIQIHPDMLNPSPWIDRCGQSPWIQSPRESSGLLPPLDWPWNPQWYLPECQQTPVRNGQDWELEVDENDDGDEEDVNVNFNTNTNTNVKG